VLNSGVYGPRQPLKSGIFDAVIDLLAARKYKGISQELYQAIMQQSLKAYRIEFGLHGGHQEKVIERVNGR
jgi:hypothetical protein